MEKVSIHTIWPYLEKISNKEYMYTYARAHVTWHIFEAHWLKAEKLWKALTVLRLKAALDEEKYGPKSKSCSKPISTDVCSDIIKIIYNKIHIIQYLISLIGLTFIFKVKYRVEVLWTKIINVKRDFIIDLSLDIDNFLVETRDILFIGDNPIWVG